MIGISINPKIGIGDALQYSSLPENYYLETGKKLYDKSQPWFFDHNPYVVRTPYEGVSKVVEMWNFSPKQWEWPRPRLDGVYLSNSEIYASLFGVKKPLLNRPRLYKFEDYPFENREKILIHTQGKSHGQMPDFVIDHILKKYKGSLCQIGLPGVLDLGIPYIQTKTLWDLAYVISQSRMLICMDSGPAWIGACYPDVWVKKLRMKPSIDVLRSWVPLAIDNVHSHWDDRCHQIFNPSEHDVGFTSSYRKL